MTVFGVWERKMRGPIRAALRCGHVHNRVLPINNGASTLAVFHIIVRKRLAVFVFWRGLLPSVLLLHGVFFADPYIFISALR